MSVGPLAVRCLLGPEAGGLAGESSWMGSSLRTSYHRGKKKPHLTVDKRHLLGVTPFSGLFAAPRVGRERQAAAGTKKHGGKRACKEAYRRSFFTPPDVETIESPSKDNKQGNEITDAIAAKE